MNATTKRRAVIAAADKHALTEEAKSRKAASAAKNAKSPKASNQTAIEAKPKAKVLTKGKTKAETMRELDRELQQEAAKEGTVRARDQITVNENAPNTDQYRMVGTTDGQPLMIPQHKFVGALAEAAKKGSSFREFKAMWAEIQKNGTGKLANGLDGRSAPHCSKSVGDKAAKGTNKADKVMARKATETAKKAERKTERAAKAPPKADDNRKIVVVDKKFSYGREGSARNAAWQACTASKTVAEYAAKGGALKYLPRWAAAGAIKLG